MRIERTKSFIKDYKKLPEEIKKRTDKALRLFVENPYHPSLGTKKTQGEVLKGYTDIFEGRITRDYRFLFYIHKDYYYLVRCRKHDDIFK